MKRARTWLLVAALTLGVGGAALAQRPRHSAAPKDVTVASIDVFEVAALLAEAPPDTLVVVMDTPKHALRGAAPMGQFGADDAAFVERAPKARAIVLAGRDQVRMDKLARSLLAAGRRVTVLKGGLAAWDAAMDADPKAPPATAPSAVWARYRTEVALRRSFGDAESAPPAPVLVPPAPIAPAAGPAGGAPKKREGC